MLKIVIPKWEDWDPVQEKFIYGGPFAITMEHSLVSISKWEAKYHKAFLNDRSITNVEMLDYIKFMTLSQHIPDEAYLHMTQDNLADIERYIGDSMTATTFSNQNKKTPKREIVTSELIYYWMIAYGIPFECQKWHLNRLMTLIQVAAIKNTPSKKMSKREGAAKYSSLNAARRARHHSKG